MSDREAEYKERIRANLENVLDSGFVPELGEHKKGKVRDVHFSGDKVVMVASDRVSCFDRVLSRCIPYKGAVLNLFNRWAMENSSEIVPNAMLESPDVNVIVQRKLKNAGFECVVRGYVWGSLASDYEQGLREKSGVRLPDGWLRYQKLPHPMFTPAAKEETGHDEDVGLEDIEKVHGRVMADIIKHTSRKLYERGAELAERAGMLFIDTKYEFGLDEQGNLYLIDEANTPDSSRYCDRKEWEEKFAKIQELMKDSSTITRLKARTSSLDVSSLLNHFEPQLKIKEASKQFVRDVLIKAGYREGMPLPELTDEQVVETAWRYISSYERLTGKKFDFSASELPTARKRIMNNLVRAGLAYGGCVVPIGASGNDKEHWGKLEAALKEAGIPFTKPFYASAHKETRRVLDFVADMDSTSIEPLVYLTFAGRSNGLGPVVAGNTNYPVITCPVFSDIASYAVDIHSSLRMPSRLPLATIVDPGNAALFAKRVIGVLK